MFVSIIVGWYACQQQVPTVSQGQRGLIQDTVYQAVVFWTVLTVLSFKIIGDIIWNLPSQSSLSELHNKLGGVVKQK